MNVDTVVGAEPRGPASAAASANGEAVPRKEPPEARAARLVETAAALLPWQGPITSFAFLNTLQGLEHLPFDEGLRLGSALHGCEPYWPENKYWELLAEGRVRDDDLAMVLLEDLGDRAEEFLGFLGTRYELRLEMLRRPPRQAAGDELRWLMAETDAQRAFRPDAPAEHRRRMTQQTRDWLARQAAGGLKKPAATERVALSNSGNGDPEGWTGEGVADWFARARSASAASWPTARWEEFCLRLLWNICQEGARQAAPAAPEPTAERRASRALGLDEPLPQGARPFADRHRDLLRAATGEDSDGLVHDLLIRFCGAFTDQGFAGWELPGRDQGFFRCFVNYFASAPWWLRGWRRELARELTRLRNAALSPRASLVESLGLLGVAEHDWSEFLMDALLALRGWAGMLWQLESRPDRAARPVPPGTLVEFVAARLVAERVALAHLARRRLGFQRPLAELRGVLRGLAPREAPREIDERAFVLFQVAQARGWSPVDLLRLGPREWTFAYRELEAFSSIERRRLYHAAYERRFRDRALDALAGHVRRPVSGPGRPPLQAVFCIDAREESFRRHLEEISPHVQTFGAAGFFGSPFYYRGLVDAHYRALCPIVVFPKHWVVEDVPYSLRALNRRQALARRALGAAAHRFRSGSWSLAGGAVLTGGLGVLATIPLVARAILPRLSSRLRHTAERFLEPPAVTRLRLERAAPTPGAEDDQIGFSHDEMANACERLLREIGLLDNFARLVLINGHGSSCWNNPHESAYHCGACSGNAGGPNARAIAAMLNHPKVRDLLRARGIDLPDDTLFLGGLHNTCNDSVTFFDLDLLPRSHVRDFEAAQQWLAEACERNAHERCRRFDSAPAALTPRGALRHVEERSEDLAQTRPEYGNSTNALCVVGRRERTSGLFLDRRSFLMSYDPTRDDARCSVLARILAAVVPVCSGINLQYLLSAIDNRGWGSGTKLPHNVVGLLGVMDGAASDLRPGLPWQGVDIHEPMRLLFVVETTPAGMFQVMDSNPTVRNILQNGWAQLAVLSPESNDLQIFAHGGFHRYRPASGPLPQVENSLAWYRGQRDHLEFAELKPPRREEC